MRLFLFLLIVSTCVLALNDTQNSSGITVAINVTTNVSCPGDLLSMNATTLDGQPVSDLELRLILYLPYQGLRGIEHTDNNGLASLQITAPGDYRLYIISSDYIHDNYVEFNYPELCPPPPPTPINITLQPECNENLLLISASSNGTPLNGVFISTQNWSSLTGPSGNISFPLYEGYVFINATKNGYAPQQFYYNVDCSSFCSNTSDCNSNQSCLSNQCVNLSGTCGYPTNHTWVNYRCCTDGDCPSGFLCQNNTCFKNQSIPPVQAPNLTNTTLINNSVNVTKSTSTTNGACLPSILLFMLLLCCLK